MVVQLLRAAVLRPAILVVIAGRVYSFNFGITAPWRQLRQEHQPYLINNQHQRQFQLASTSVGHEEDVAALQTTATTFVSGIDEEDEGDDYSDSENLHSDDFETPGSRCQILLEALIKSTTSALTGLTKKKASLENELSKAQSLEATMNRANLIASNLYKLPPGTIEAEVEDWENDGIIVKLVLNTKEYGTFQEESDALFAAARKMKRGSAIVEELLAQTTDAEEILNDSLIDLQSMENSEQLDEGTMILIQERLERTSKTTGWKPPKHNTQDDSSGVRSKQRKNTSQQKTNKSKPNPREFTSPSGHKVLVGRNRRDNESICFQLSKPTDIWMHARGCPGAHVLLCCRRGSPDITDVDLQFAADLAAFYSDARTETKTDITTASPKDITKPRGAPLGAVTLRQEGKTLLGRPADVAKELKEAREQSGANWSELGYRKLGGRAKNKKKTAAVEKETAKKRREEARENNKRRQRKE